ncbi:phospholipase C, phosphocholine-specific [Stagnimonas aquatica]|uniref:phospholipase C n=1 Tax=Stagnimonas aquatica TaxID=2689987 RepID=A0A3N0VDS2_9GAMM|nr:phospholipase C, phosphocholine-specific [Stagnimonas aquatica]ROH90825.1 phospholipase C, phosphocholine-specific [Stagnimonas aquatica]
MDRRRFLQLAGSTAAASLMPQCIRDALAIPANNKSGTIQDVEHVVILMQENRSFDHYFGTMAGVRGFGDRFTIPLPGGLKVWEQTYSADGSSRTLMPYHLDKSKGNALRVAQLTALPHSWSDAQPAWNNGRIDQWPTYKTEQSMGYYKQAEVEFQFALANAFTVCDHYHAAIHAGTNPNRIFHWTGTNDPSGAGGGPATSNANDSLDASSSGYSWTTYPERLQQAGVRWKVYQNLPDNFTDNPLAGFKQYRAANEAAGNNSDGFPYPAYDEAQDASNPLYKGVANTLPNGNTLNPNMLADFAADITAGKLPQVSWVIAPMFYSEHPGPSSPVQGAWYVQEVLNALTADPELFSKTVLIVNFDENDGFFDHLPPPCAPSMNEDGSLAGKSTLADISSEYHSGDEYKNHAFGPGPRVPMMLISPWSRGGWVCSQSFDHTSVLRFLEQRFGVIEPNIGPWRRAFCGDLTSCFNFVDPNNDNSAELPALTKLGVDTVTLTQSLLLPVAVPSESEQSLPVQETGVRLSRALPYELHASAELDARTGRLRLVFANTGSAGAVFHVYDRLHLDRNPRRYGVEAGKLLDDHWDLNADDGAYDLWVLSHNGWHRHFTGNLFAQAEPLPELRVCYDIANGGVYLQTKNDSASARTLKIRANAYFGDGPWSLSLRPYGAADHGWSLASSGNWYDFTVTIEGDDSGYSRRFAGRVETGEPLLSDPAMGLG